MSRFYQSKNFFQRYNLQYDNEKKNLVFCRIRRKKTQTATMDAIKKKMQGMKLEKDNAMDRALLCEQQARDANARAEKVKFIIAASINSSKTSL